MFVFAGMEFTEEAFRRLQSVLFERHFSWASNGCILFDEH